MERKRISMNVIPPTQKDADEINKYLQDEIEKLPPCPYCGGELSVNVKCKQKALIPDEEAFHFGLLNKDKDKDAYYLVNRSAVIYCPECKKHQDPHVLPDYLTLPIGYTVKSKDQMIKAMHDLINGFKAFWYWEYKK